MFEDDSEKVVFEFTSEDGQEYRVVRIKPKIFYSQYKKNNIWFNLNGTDIILGTFIKSLMKD